MIRAHRVAATAQDDASLVSGWNIAPNVAYSVALAPGATSCGVFLFAESGALVASGAALVGTEQPCVLIPQSGQTIGMIDAELGWHLLLTTVGTEAQRTIRINPSVDLPDEIHPIYGEDGLALVRATAGIDGAAHYIDDLTVTCPLGLGAGLGDVASVPVDGAAVVGQVESITWTGTPNGASEQAVIRRHVAIAPAPAVVPPAPPVVVNDAGETAADETTSGNVLTNDTSGLTVTAVNGLSANVGVAVAGNNGGVFTFASNGAWTFDPNGDFAALTGSDTANTSVTYHASDGAGEAGATLTVTVSAGGIETDPMWADVALLIQAPETGSTIADAKGKTVAVQGNTVVSNALGYPTILFDGNGDRLDVGTAGDFNFLHNGSSWTIETTLRPSRRDDDDTIIDTIRGTQSNAGVFIAYSSGKIRVMIGRAASGTFVINATLDYSFSDNVEKTVCLEYDHALTTGALKMYVEGALVAIADKTENSPSTVNHQQMMVGMFHASYPTYAYQGHMRYLRITAGVRNGVNHTSPAWPLPTA